MTKAVAGCMRAEMARLGWSATRLAAESGIPKSTLHRSLRADRAIDVEDVFAFTEFLGLDIGEFLNRAADEARPQIDDGQLLIERTGLTPDEYATLTDEGNAAYLEATTHQYALAAETGTEQLHSEHRDPSDHTGA